MSSPTYTSGLPERFVEVDAARLLLILVRFAREPDTVARSLRCYPERPVSTHFTPEYWLHKLDFLLRYPSYFAYEIVELHRLGVSAAQERADVRQVVSAVLREREPELRTEHFRRFWRGAYERIDRVEAWWHAHEFVYVGLERRGDAPAQKHYFLTEKAHEVASGLANEVPQVQWYVQRVEVIHRFFGSLSPAQVRDLQYQHPAYRDASLEQRIPDLPTSEVERHLAAVLDNGQEGLQ